MTWFAHFLDDDLEVETKPRRELPRARPPPIKSDNIWTPEKIELAKKLWQDGLSANKVAAELGPDFTRNSVLGKLHRTGSQARTQPLRPTSNKRPPRKAAIRPELRPPARKQSQPFSFKKGPPMIPVPFSPSPAIVTPICEPVTIMGLNEHTCRFPLTDDPRVPTDEFMYCGALPIGIGESYCEFHFQLSYTGAFPRRDVVARPRV